MSHVNPQPSKYRVTFQDNKTFAFVYGPLSEKSIAEARFDPNTGRMNWLRIDQSLTGWARECITRLILRIEEYGTCVDRTEWVKDYPDCATWVWDYEHGTYALAQDLEGPLRGWTMVEAA